MNSAQYARITRPCNDDVTTVGVFPEDHEWSQRNASFRGRITLQIDAGVTMLHLRPTIAEARELVAILQRAISDVEAAS